MKNSSNSSTGNSCNTKQISPAKHWILTLNNYTPSDIDFIIKTDKAIVPKYVFQEEIGELKKYHIYKDTSNSRKSEDRIQFLEKTSKEHTGKFARM